MAVFDVIILGAGAAGLMCAIEAAKRGRKVMVLDHANKAGKKILMSGGGRCNFTNYYVEPENYLSKNPHFCKSALSRYTQWDFIGLVEQHGIAYHEKKSGQLFCDNKAQDILTMLLDECQQYGAQVQLNTSIEAVEAIEQGFQLNTSQGKFRCHSLVVATGGLSIPTLGATGYGYQVAEQFGHDLLARSAALVPFTISDSFKQVCQQLSGSSCAVTVSCGAQSFAEDMLFTHRGLSGPAILQISSYWQPGKAIEIDFLPEQNLAEQLRELQHNKAKSLLRTILAQWLPQKMVGQLLGYSCPELCEKNLAELSAVDMDLIAAAFHQFQITPAGTEGYRTAEVTLGGVDSDQVSSKTLMSKLQPDLYFIGEVIDVSGHLGGFNFQWAWASGWCAGQEV